MKQKSNWLELTRFFRFCLHIQLHYFLSLFFVFLFLFAVKLSFLPFVRSKIESFMSFFRDNWPYVKITLKFYIVEKHVVDFIAKWGAAFGYYEGQDTESLDNEFKKLNRTYCSITPSDWNIF